MGSGSKWGVPLHCGDITREAVRRPLTKSIASLQYPPPERNGAGHPPAGPWGTGVAILRGSEWKMISLYGMCMLIVLMRVKARKIETKGISKLGWIHHTNPFLHAVALGGQGANHHRVRPSIWAAGTASALSFGPRPCPIEQISGYCFAHTSFFLQKCV